MIEFDLHLDRSGFALNAAASVTGQITGLFGPSGSGKTTLLHLLAGLLRPTRGRIVVNGRVLCDLARRIDLPPPARRMALVFQDLRLFPHYSVRGNLVYGQRRRVRSGGATQSRLEAITDLLKLGRLMSRRVSELSGGERQRVALGRAILTSPDLLLLDEPLASLDRPLRREIIAYLRDLQRVCSFPIIIVSHDLTDLLQLTNSLMVMRNGSLVGPGSYGDLLHDAQLDARAALCEPGTINVLEARVGATDAEAGLTALEIGLRGDAADEPGCRLLAPPAHEAPGATVAVQVRSQDIALARSAVSGVSIQNQLPATVARISEYAGKSLVELHLDHSARLQVDVSPKTVRDLELAPGRPVWCLIKSSAVEYL